HILARNDVPLRVEQCGGRRNRTGTRRPISGRRSAPLASGTRWRRIVSMRRRGWTSVLSKSLGSRGAGPIEAAPQRFVAAQEFPVAAGAVRVDQRVGQARKPPLLALVDGAAETGLHRDLRGNRDDERNGDLWQPE